MFGKTLLTIGIILLAIIWLRNMRRARMREEQSALPGGTPRDRMATAAGKAAPRTRLNDYRFAAWLFLALIVGSGSYLYYLRWQEDNSVVTVILHRDGSNEPVTYQVLRNQLGNRAFTTVDGIRVTVAASERMEVLGL
ncbi:MAG: hypothetical protein ACRER5_10685 [Pseudomonas sp.]